MIHLLHGKDDYLVRRALAGIRERLRDADDMLDTNTTVLPGATLTPQELFAHATAVPFLAANRLVIVEGLLAALAQVRGGRRKKAASDENPLAAWEDLAARLGDATALPESTTLIFVEGALDTGSAAYTTFAPIARIEPFEPVKRGDLARWITDRAAEMDVDLHPSAAQALAELLGNDLWAIDRELEKLSTYAAGARIDRALVQQMTGALASPRVFDLTDAVAAGNEGKALATLRALISDGEPPPLLASMLVRQYRQLVLVKERRERGDSEEVAARAAGLPNFNSIVRQVNALASRYTWPALRAAYQQLLDADLNVKRGLQDDESALQLAVHELCALAPKSSARPAYAR